MKRRPPARMAGTTAEQTLRMKSRSRSEDGSATGAVGTPLYMAPEQLAGDAPTPAADQYALAASAYEMIGGVRMRQGTFEQVMIRASQGLLPDVPDGFPRAAVEVLQRALAREPAERFPSAGAFAAALREALLPGSTRVLTRRAWLIGAATVALAGGVGASLWWLQPASPDELLLAVIPGNRAVLGPAYEPLGRYLSKRLDRPVRIAIPGSYDQLLDGLAAARLHVALLSPKPGPTPCSRCTMFNVPSTYRRFLEHFRR